MASSMDRPYSSNKKSPTPKGANLKAGCRVSPKAFIGGLHPLDYYTCDHVHVQECDLHGLCFINPICLHELEQWGRL
ncbi:hypothetical protein VNO77_03215 [Canavalia gladiata]|uniref:Uncharacterized protein n=1 Tax=Canavalia gladiata TaxID=3824 RepID=A0AAN9MUG1_CANGL